MCNCAMDPCVCLMRARVGKHSSEPWPLGRVFLVIAAFAAGYLWGVFA